MTEFSPETSQSTELALNSSIVFSVVLSKQHQRRLMNTGKGIAEEMTEGLPHGISSVIYAISNADGSLLCDARIEMHDIDKAHVLHTLIELMNEDSRLSTNMGDYRQVAINTDTLELLYTDQEGNCVCVGIYDLEDGGLGLSVTNNYPNRPEGKIVAVPSKVDTDNLPGQVNRFMSVISSFATLCLRIIGNSEGEAFDYKLRPSQAHFDRATAFYETKFELIADTSESEQVIDENKKLFLDRFVGYEPQREKVERFIELFMHKDVAEAWGVSGSSSLIIRGPSGTGKTLLAGEICERIGGKIRVVDASDMVDKYVGETAKNINGFFESVVAESETTTQIIILKPLEAFATDNDGVQSERGSAAITLASWIRTINTQHPNIVVIGITGNTQAASSMVSGSFEESVSIGEPSDTDRYAIWSSLLFNASMRIGPGKISPTLGEEIDQLVAASSGMTGREIVGIMRSTLRDKALGQIMLNKTSTSRVQPIGLRDILLQIQRFGTSR